MVAGTARIETIKVRRTCVDKEDIDKHEENTCSLKNPCKSTNANVVHLCYRRPPYVPLSSRCIGDLHDIFCSQGAIASIAEPSIGATIHTPPPTQPPAGMRRADEGVPKQSSAPTKQAEPRCESALVYTNLFAIPPTLSPTNRLSPPSRLRGGNVPGAHGGSAVGVDDIGNMGSTGAWGSDLSRLSRWGLAIRAPTLAEFISADMLLVPGKIWKWFAEDDILGRKLQ